MKFLLLVLILTANALYGQVIYSDNYDTGIGTTTSTPGLSTSSLNQALRITGNGTSGNYAALAYNFYDTAGPINIDLSSNSKMYIKAKGTNSPKLRIDLQDDLGYATTKIESVVDLTSSYNVYEIDYSDKFIDAGYGGTSCAIGTGPCNVKNNALRNLVLFVNAANGGYNGTIDIDWISFGQALEVIPQPIFLRANLVGYFKNGPKAVNLISKSPFVAQTFEVFNSNNTSVLSGTTTASSSWADANQHIAKIDLSSLTINGTYKVVASGNEISIRILDNPLIDLSVGSLKYFYFNRSSTEITVANGGAWARASGTPDLNVKVHASAVTSNRPENTVIASPKGWYDAGDLNKYTVNSGISTYTLLTAFENYKPYYETINLNIPESGNSLPDILDETIWNLDWMLTMQNRVADGGDGSVYHKLSGLNFEGTIMPANYNLQRYVIGRSTSAALNFAAVMAVASRIFTNYEDQKPGYSAKLLDAAIEAYTWAKNNPSRLFTGNPPGVSTGPYEDSYVGDEFQWAAVELFITTGESSYKDEINYTTLTSQNVPYWGGTSSLGVLSIANNLNNVNVAQLDTNLVKTKIKAIANTLKSNVNNNLIETAMNNTDYNWGSNGGAANQIMILISAYKASNDVAYLNAAYKAIDYLLGRNAVGISFVTGYGDSAPLDPHHRPSAADGVALPVPGMLVGGPQNAVNPDGCNYPDGSKAGKYSDTYCSYSTNEVTINWNAPLAYAVNALSYYQSTGTLSTDAYSAILEQDNIFIYPNPIKSTVNIKLEKISENSFLQVYSIDGRMLLEQKLKFSENTINLSNFENGIYIFKINQDKKEFIKKIVKN